MRPVSLLARCSRRADANRCGAQILTGSDIWVSHFFNDSRYIRGGKVDWDAPGWCEIKDRRQPPTDTLPRPMYANAKREDYQHLPPAFAAGGGLNVCSPLADVFRRFDLGTGGVVPIKLFKFDRTTPVDADYFLLTVVDRKGVFIPSESHNLFVGYRTTTPPEHSAMPLEPKNEDIAVSDDARIGSDMWFDAKLPDALFMSGRLVAALKEVGFARNFNPVKCRVIRLH